MTIKILSCLRCAHEWASKLKIGEPKNCPKCKSPYWNRPRTRFVWHRRKPRLNDSIGGV
jgi:predicted Zn-ribbon and HTH transcriptional regulator